MAEKKASPHMKNKAKSVPGTASDSEGSIESSPSVDSANDIVVPRTPPKDNPVPAAAVAAGKRGTRRGSEWEIVEGLRDGQRFEKRPDVFSGHLHKKRKWPLKGWHKRYFVVDKGVLVYGKSPADVTRGKLHGSVDIGLSVISTKHKRKRLDIDAEEFIYHLKAKTVDEFGRWVDMLTQHRLYRQHLLTFGTREVPSIRAQGTSVDVTDSPTIKHREKLSQGEKESSPGTPTGSRLGTWVQDSHAVIESLTKELTQAAHNLVQLAKMQEQLELIAHDSESTTDGFSPNVKKDRKKFGLRKKKSSKESSGDLTGTSPSKAGEPEPSSPSAQGLSNTHSNSNTSLPSLVCSRPQSLVADETGLSLDYRAGGTDNQLREDFAVLAKDIHSSLKLCCYRLVSERDHLRSALVADSGANLTASLRTSLHQALQQNVELKCRLAKIHSTSDLSDVASVASENNGSQQAEESWDMVTGQGNEHKMLLKPCLSYSSSCISASEFFDAEEYQPDNHETSSEVNSLSSEENSTENSEADTEYTPPDETHMVGVMTGGGTGRRTKLPVPRPDTEGLSLWNLLCKNIGQDLSQVSMPVALNEPLNMLQRMCEELEYSELLDKAAETDDRYERMVLVAAFAVSSYGSAYFRAGSKPFNPLLGETYECIREDRGFRFVAEQVSHHPPVSVCHAESRSFVFWQDARIKTKFWGKSMEFQPTGCVNLTLPKFGDHYKWNKVTTCVHNLFSGQRWVDQYGELKITNGNIGCKLTFVKASYWSAKRHEIFGTVTNEDGKVVRNLFGKWSEALYCGVAPSARCIWRPGTMPEEYELYYGFSRFAMELNELEADMAKYLPATDTRFRPDQRLLEEGNLSAAESLKLQLEQSQRERRKRKEQSNVLHQPRWFRKCLDDSWESDGKYWECRKNPGFMNIQMEALW